MKKIILLILILISKTMFSQEILFKHEAGISLSTIFKAKTVDNCCGSSVADYRSVKYNRQSYGFYYKHFVSKHVVISVLPYYSRVTFENDGIFRGYIIKYSSNEFVLPISVQLSTDNTNKTNYFIGVSMNNIYTFNEYIYSKHFDHHLIDPYGNISCSTYVYNKKFYETFNFSLLSGVNFKILDNYNLSILARYNIVRKHYIYGSYREYFLTLNLGYKF